MATPSLARHPSLQTTGPVECIATCGARQDAAVAAGTTPGNATGNATGVQLQQCEVACGQPPDDSDDTGLIIVALCCEALGGTLPRREGETFV